LTVSDRERSARFYGEHFGMTERLHDDDHLLILASSGGEELLALSDGVVPAGLPRTNHFGFLAESSAEVCSARERFRAAGVEEAEWQAHGPARVQVFDPDGYRVEIYAF
jgi:catechol 2,3-dioxygenase-like lactoylglutathione lyase family enzyme